MTEDNNQKFLNAYNRLDNYLKNIAGVKRQINLISYLERILPEQQQSELNTIRQYKNVVESHGVNPGAKKPIVPKEWVSWLEKELQYCKNNRNAIAIQLKQMLKESDNRNNKNRNNNQNNNNRNNNYQSNNNQNNNRNNNNRNNNQNNNNRNNKKNRQNHNNGAYTSDKNGSQNKHIEKSNNNPRTDKRQLSKVAQIRKALLVFLISFLGLALLVVAIYGLISTLVG